MADSFEDPKAPVSVCWNITSRCNADCKFCFREKNFEELTLDDNIRILEKLHRSGVKKISWVGGEPTLYPSLIPLAIEAKSKGFVTSLTTNASVSAIRIIQQGIVPFDWLTIPLDAATSRGQIHMTRPPGHYERVLSLLKQLSRKSLPRLKINTVISAQNICCILPIFTILEDYCIERWKLFRFLGSRGAAEANRAFFAIDDNEFSAFALRLRVAHAYHPKVKISIIDSPDYTDSHFNISPNGDVESYSKAKYYSCGNLLTEDMSSLFLRSSVANEKIFDRSSFSSCTGRSEGMRLDANML